MRTQVRLRTALFAPLTGDSDQVENGRELAQWLCAHLPVGMQADAMPEDWGWRVLFGASDLSANVSVCCGHVDGDQWSCACEIEGGPGDAQLESVIRAIDSLLAGNPAFTEVEWFANDAQRREFDHAPRPFAQSQMPDNAR